MEKSWKYKFPPLFRIHVNVSRVTFATIEAHRYAADLWLVGEEVNFKHRVRCILSAEYRRSVAGDTVCKLVGTTRARAVYLYYSSAPFPLASAQSEGNFRDIPIA